MKIAVASKNRGKINEISEILRIPDIRFFSYLEMGIEWTPPEEGDESYERNAITKALDLARISDLFAIADDSGLEVDALGGKPGVTSNRFGGDGLTDSQKNDLILNLIEGKPVRSARFICVAAFAAPDGRTWTRVGTVNGNIAKAPSGKGGFGYDPIFIPEGFEVTMAELPPEMKNNISHRAKAFKALREIIEKFFK